MIKPLTSLRMFFALFVFLSHLAFLKNDTHYANIFNSIFDEGFLGVSFFFILSGFILAYNYKEKILTGNISKKEFYISRLVRIYPVHIAMTALVLLLTYLRSGTGWEYLIQHIFLIQSFFLEENVHFSLNSPSWSISDEMFFYLLFPFLFLISEKIRVYIFILYLVGIFLLNIQLDKNQGHYWLYISPLIRFSDFLLGIILFDFYEKIKFYYSKINIPTFVFELSAILLFVLFFVFHSKIDISYRYSMYYWLPMAAIIFVFALSYVVKEKSIITRFLSNKYMVLAGEISFSFYLLHVLEIQVLNYIKNILSVHMDLMLFSIIIFLVTLLASLLMYKYIEKPLNRKMKKFLLEPSLKTKSYELKE
ncbi:MAG: acyltransferase family protein [Acinetobacter sp.]